MHATLSGRRFRGSPAPDGIAEAAGISGRLGAQILRRPLGAEAEFTLVTYWSTWASVRAYAGQDAERAVLYPGDERFELTLGTRRPHRFVTHFTDDGLVTIRAHGAGSSIGSVEVGCDVVFVGTGHRDRLPE